MSETRYESCAGFIAQPALTRKLIRGAAVGILDGGYQESFAIGAGIAVDSLSETGSLTKVFTGILLAALVHQNRISLEDPVCRYLPSWVCSTTLNPVRIIDLATHTSGLPLLPADVGRLKRRVDDPYAGYTFDDFYRYLSQISLERPARPTYAYSNVGFALLAHLMANATQIPFAELMNQEVFRPLGLADSVVEVSDAHEDKLVRGHTELGFPAAHWPSPVFAGCGGVCSTVNDCLRFLQVWMSPPDGWDCIVKESLIPRVPSEKIGETSHLSLAWKINQTTGWYWHNGITGGHSAYMSFHPGRRQGIVVMTNRYAIEVVDQLGRKLQKILEGSVAEPIVPKLFLKRALATQMKIEFVHMPFWARSAAAAAAGGSLLTAALMGMLH